MAVQETQSVFAGLFAPAIAPSTGGTGGTSRTGRTDAFTRELDRVSERERTAPRDKRNDGREVGSVEHASASTAHPAKRDSAERNVADTRHERANAANGRERHRTSATNKERGVSVEIADAEVAKRTEVNSTADGAKVAPDNKVDAQLALTKLVESMMTATTARGVQGPSAEEITEFTTPLATTGEKNDTTSAIQGLVAKSAQTNSAYGLDTFAQKLSADNSAVTSPDNLTAFLKASANANDSRQSAFGLESMSETTAKNGDANSPGAEGRVEALSVKQSSDTRALLNALNGAQSSGAILAQKSKTQSSAGQNADGDKADITTKDNYFDEQLLLKAQTNQTGQKTVTGDPVAQMSAALKRQAEAAKSGVTNVDLSTTQDGPKPNTEFAGLLRGELAGNTTTRAEATVAAKVIIPEDFGALVKGKTDSITLKISPAHLGEAKLSLSVQKHMVNGSLLVESQAAKSAVESSLDKLVERLAQEGLQLDRLDVEVSGDQWREDRHAAWERNARHSGRRFSLEDDSDAALNIAPPAARSAMGTSVIGANGVNALA